MKTYSSALINKGQFPIGSPIRGSNQGLWTIKETQESGAWRYVSDNTVFALGRIELDFQTILGNTVFGNYRKKDDDEKGRSLICLLSN